jgi:hypothetical protein
VKNFIASLFFSCIFTVANSTEKPINNIIDSTVKKSESLNNNNDRMNKESIVILISRAYEFGQGNDKFCSPEISATNLGGIGVRIIAVSIFFRKNNKNIGSAITRMSIDPRDTTTRGYYQLQSKNCDEITGVGRIDVCILRNGKDCSEDAFFADSGKIPLERIKKD